MNVCQALLSCTLLLSCLPAVSVLRIRGAGGDVQRGNPLGGVNDSCDVMICTIAGRRGKLVLVKCLERSVSATSLAWPLKG